MKLRVLLYTVSLSAFFAPLVGAQGLADSAEQSQQAGAPTSQMSVAQWFQNYDQIRHQAQMSPQERRRADALMSKGMSILMPGDEKEATRKLLISMVSRYKRACEQLKMLPQLSQTAYLHHAYYNYFSTAGQLFGDYLRVQNNLFVTDATTGQPVASSLIQRKQMLEGLEHQCKQVDLQTRGQFGVAPYPW